MRDAHHHLTERADKQVFLMQSIDWVAGAEQDITSPHAITHRLAHSEGPSVIPFTADICTSDTVWMAQF